MKAPPSNQVVASLKQRAKTYGVVQTTFMIAPDVCKRLGWVVGDRIRLLIGDGDARTMLLVKDPSSRVSIRTHHAAKPDTSSRMLRFGRIREPEYPPIGSWVLRREPVAGRVCEFEVHSRGLWVLAKHLWRRWDGTSDKRQVGEVKSPPRMQMALPRQRGDAWFEFPLTTRQVEALEELPRDVRRRIMSYGVAAILCLLTAPALAHDWYSELKVPGTNMSCCNMRDCRETVQCVLPDRRLGVQVERECQPIDDRAVLPLPSPDGQMHVCVHHVDGRPRQRCTIVGGGA